MQVEVLFFCRILHSSTNEIRSTHHYWVLLKSKIWVTTQHLPCRPPMTVRFARSRSCAAVSISANPFCLFDRCNQSDHLSHILLVLGVAATLTCDLLQMCVGNVRLWIHITDTSWCGVCRERCTIFYIVPARWKHLFEPKGLFRRVSWGVSSWIFEGLYQIIFYKETLYVYFVKWLS